MYRTFTDDYIRALLSAAPIPTAGQSPAAAVIAPLAPPVADLADGMSAESQKFFAAWKAWRGDRMLPRRAEVQLTTIARLMPQLVVVEVRGPDRATFRLAGTDIERGFGARLTGRNFIKLAQPEDAKAADRAGSASPGELLLRLVSQPCAAILRLGLEYRSARSESIEIAAAPVLPDIEGAPVQVFAVVSRMHMHVAGKAADGSDPIIRNFGRNLRFLDIGAGIPATD